MKVTKEQYEIATEAIELFTPIPSENFITGIFTNYEDRCCVVGHWQRLHSKNPDDFSYENCSDFTEQFISPLRTIGPVDISIINNCQDHYGYNQPDPKSRVMAYLGDIVEAYESQNGQNVQ